MCDNGAKVSSLTLEFTSAFALQHVQADGKAQAVGDAWFLEQVDVEVSDNNGNLVATFINVSVGETFTFDESVFGDRFPSSIFISLFDPAADRKGGTATTNTSLTCLGVACVTFHTSCSWPLRVGDWFGNVRLADFVNDGGVTASSCTSSGLGCDMCDVGGDLVAITLAFHNESAILHGQDDERVEVVGDASNISYVDVVVADKFGNVVQSFINVAVYDDETVTVTAAMFGASKLPSEIQVSLYDTEAPRKGGTAATTGGDFASQCTGVLCVRFHTSCSVPLNVGNMFGIIAIADFLTSEGITNAQCSLPTPSNTRCDACQVDSDKITSLTLRYDSSSLAWFASKNK